MNRPNGQIRIIGLKDPGGNAMEYHALSTPLLYDSQLKIRLAMVRKRLEAYPLNDMNFFMMDLEHPRMRKRHADQCTYDLTGRTLLFYSVAEGIDGERAERLPELFKRIMNNRRGTGLFHETNPGEATVPGTTYVMGTHFLSGLVNYYALTGDMRALNAAEEAADMMLSYGDDFFKMFQTDGPHMMDAWICEGFAELYRETRNECYLEAVRRIANECVGTVYKAHAHGYLTTLRGFMRAAFYAQDDDLAEFVKGKRQEILDIGGVMENGDISEVFPRSHRNEGCSISDWIMLNLLYGHYYDDPDAYAKAEDSLWNALYFNQFVTGGFGHRNFGPRGYRTYVEEAWWCCTQNAGTCFAEIARHVVTVRKGSLKLNFLIPGEFTVPGENGSITVTVTTQLPVRAKSIIKVKGTKEDIDLRIPDYIKEVSVRRVETDFGYILYVDGEMGHYAEKRGDGYVLKYGPLILAPMIYSWSDHSICMEDTTIPKGYAHDSLTGQKFVLNLGETDTKGFYQLPHDPQPVWIGFEEGEMSDINGGEAAAVNVPVCFADGTKKELYFQPLCSATSTLMLLDVPIVFDLA